MGYPVAYRRAAQQLGHAASKAFKETPAEPVQKPANDNHPAPANDNAPSFPGETALSPGAIELAATAAAFLPGPAGVIAPILIQFGAPVLLTALKSWISYLFIPSNWSEHGCNSGQTQPNPTLQTGWVNGVFHKNQRGSTAEVPGASINPAWLTASWINKHAVFFGLNGFGLRHVLRSSPGAVPEWLPIINPWAWPREQLEPVVNPAAHPAVRPVAAPVLLPYPPPYRDRPLVARAGRQDGWRDSGPLPQRGEAVVPEAPPVPPGRGTREAKGSNRALQRLLQAAGAVTEVHDALQCLSDSIPKKKGRPRVLGRRINGMTIMPWGDYKSRTGGWKKGTAYTRSLYKQRLGAPVNQSFQNLASDVYKNWNDINWQEFQTCFLENEVEDRLIGGASQVTTKNFKPFAPDSGANRGYEASLMGTT